MAKRRRRGEVGCWHNVAMLSRKRRVEFRGNRGIAGSGVGNAKSPAGAIPSGSEGRPRPCAGEPSAGTQTPTPLPRSTARAATHVSSCPSFSSRPAGRKSPNVQLPRPPPPSEPARETRHLPEATWPEPPQRPTFPPSCAAPRRTTPSQNSPGPSPRSAGRNPGELQASSDRGQPAITGDARPHCPRPVGALDDL